MMLPLTLLANPTLNGGMSGNTTGGERNSIYSKSFGCAGLCLSQRGRAFVICCGRLSRTVIGELIVTDRILPPPQRHIDVSKSFAHHKAKIQL
jgi:hypothetical protein